MKLSIQFITFALLLNSAKAQSSPTSFVLPDGRNVTIELSSAPVDLAIAGRRAPTSLQSRECNVTFSREIPGRTALLKVQREARIVLGPTNSVLWFGPADTKVIEMDQRLFGVKQIEDQICMFAKPEIELEYASVTPEAAAVAILRADPDALDLSSKAVLRLDLSAVFGRQRIREDNGSAVPRIAVWIKKILPMPDRLSLELLSEGGDTFFLEIGNNFEVIRADVNGLLEMLVRDPMRFERFEGWSKPQYYAHQTLDGPGNSRSLSKRMKFTDGSGNQVNFGARAVVTSSGKLWIGPNTCRIVESKGRLLGLLPIKADKILNIFDARKGAFPATADTLSALEDELLAWEDEVRRSGLEPAHSILIPAEFEDYPELTQSLQISLGALKCTEQGVQIELRAYEPNARLYLVLDEAFSVSSTQCLPGIH